MQNSIAVACTPAQPHSVVGWDDEQPNRSAITAGRGGSVVASLSGRLVVGC